jgi:hypothetical protein
MTDIGTTKTKKEGMEQINMSRTEEKLTPWFTIRSVIFTIFAIRKIKVNKIRLTRKGGIISLKIYLLTMLLTFMIRYHASERPLRKRELCAPSYRTPEEPCPLREAI